MIGYIYKVTNLVNGKIYIGSTIRKLSVRWSNHLHDSKNPKCRFHYAIRKHGSVNFNMEPIFCTKEINDLHDIENKFIEFYDSINFDKGYNSITAGGNRDLISFQMKAAWRDPETRTRRTLALKKAGLKRGDPIIGVSMYDGHIKEFSSINQAGVTGGFAKPGILWSINKECVTSQKYVWFRKSEDIDFVKEAERRLGGFKRYLVSPIKRTDKFTKEVKVYPTVKDVEADGFKVKNVIRAIKLPKRCFQYVWEYA